MRDPSPASMSLAKLLALLTPGQAWSLAAGICAVIVGSFTLGIHASSYRAEQLTHELNKSATELSALKVRSEFFMGYTRFLIARQRDYERTGFAAQVGGEAQNAAHSLARLIAPWVEPTGEALLKYDPGSTPTVTKGFAGNNDSHIKFADLGDTWPIPGLVKDFVIQSRNSAR